MTPVRVNGVGPKAKALGLLRNSLQNADQQVDALLDSALKKQKDAALFLELARRGYDLSSLRRVAAPTATEIVKIG